MIDSRPAITEADLHINQKHSANQRYMYEMSNDTERITINCHKQTNEQ